VAGSNPFCGIGVGRHSDKCFVRESAELYWREFYPGTAPGNFL